MLVCFPCWYIIDRMRTESLELLQKRSRGRGMNSVKLVKAPFPWRLPPSPIIYYWSITDRTRRNFCFGSSVIHVFMYICIWSHEQYGHLIFVMFCFVTMYLTPPQGKICCFSCSCLSICPSVCLSVWHKSCPLDMAWNRSIYFQKLGTNAQIRRCAKAKNWNSTYSFYEIFLFIFISR